MAGRSSGIEGTEAVARSVAGPGMLAGLEKGWWHSGTSGPALGDHEYCSDLIRQVQSPAAAS